MRRVAVVVPARNEERALPRCLEAVGAAVDALVRERGGMTGRGAAPTVDVVVVADRCADGTARLARAWGARTLTTAYGAVGAARAEGADWADRRWRAAGVDPDTAWMACTDADSTVPRDWLIQHLDLADAGADCVIGTVEPVGLPEALAEAWHQRHHLGEGHPHVHGANLGVRAAAYLAVGGFAGLRAHEDVDLVRRLRAADRVCVATDVARVATSGRLRSRVEDGFAAYLAKLSAAVAAAPLTPPKAVPTP